MTKSVPNLGLIIGWVALLSFYVFTGPLRLVGLLPVVPAWTSTAVDRIFEA